MKLALALILPLSVFGCTTIIVGKDASADGSVMCTHSDDGESNPDARIVRVPGVANIAAGEKRNIFWDTEDYPRHVGDKRGVKEYMVANNPGQSPSVAIGTIPEVNSTYGYFEANYGIMNEWSVGFGESTCSGVFGTNSVGHGGKALLSIDSLSRIAMERAKTSKQAVHIMGTLAEKYGFYGAGSFEGSAESLMVVDPTEGWIFQILPDDTGASAIWAAARVPDDHVGIVANMFTIRGLDVDDTKNFAFSASVHTIAQKKGWWKPDDGPLDFTAIYSDGEYAHKFYSGRRMWGGYGMLAPSVKLPDNYTDLRFDTVYPTFVKPDKKVTVADLLAVHRTFYEGTKYDMTKGVAAGPFGNPDRFKTQGITKIKGAWERSIGLFRTTQAHVLQARSWLPKGQGGVVWYGPHAAHGSCFVPLTVGMTELPISHTTADPRTIDRTSAWWAHKYVLNMAHLRYSNMMADIVDARSILVNASIALLKALDGQALAAATSSSTSQSAFLKDATAKLVANAVGVTKAWWSLPDMLMYRYADNFYNNGAPMAYPDAWLTSKEVGYTTGPPPPPQEPNMVMV